MSALERFKQHLEPGRVYRRADLAACSNAIDRHLRQLVDAGVLRKLMTGVYHRPSLSSFGPVPSDETRAIEAFLKDGDFLIVSLNDYNSLGLGTTQIYNERLVYNFKRDGRFRIDGQRYRFMKRRMFPRTVTEAFMLVDLVNNLDLLAEDRVELARRVAGRAQTIGEGEIRDAARAFGKPGTRKFFERVFDKGPFADAR